MHPIVSVDSIPVGEGEIGPITAGLWAHYEALVRGTIPDHGEWRTPVYGAQAAGAAAERYQSTRVPTVPGDRRR